MRGEQDAKDTVSWGDSMYKERSRERCQEKKKLRI